MTNLGLLVKKSRYCLKSVIWAVFWKFDLRGRCNHTFKIVIKFYSFYKLKRILGSFCLYFHLLSLKIALCFTQNINFADCTKEFYKYKRFLGNYYFKSLILCDGYKLIFLISSWAILAPSIKLIVSSLKSAIFWL